MGNRTVSLNSFRYLYKNHASGKMFTILKNVLGIGARANYKDLIKHGAQIVDVRTRAEYGAGHIPGSINIPLNELSNAESLLDRNSPVIICCASGIRSASATSVLLSRGFTKVYNGGGWSKLQQTIH